MRWFRLAAEQGNVVGQRMLGAMYIGGQGVPPNGLEAVRWFRLAAEQGNIQAQGTLGIMYERGEGVPKDAVTAYAWYSIAAAQGDESVQRFKESITQRMSRSRLAKAQELSREYWTLYVLPFQ